MEEQVQFFFKHAAKVISVKQCYDEAQKYILAQLELVAGHFKWQINGTRPSMRYIWDAANKAQAYYIIDFTDLLTEKKQVTVVLELYGDATSKVAFLNSQLAGNPLLSALERTGYQTQTYWHYAKKTYAWNPEVDGFADFITKCIEADLHPLMLEILTLIHRS